MVKIELPYEQQPAKEDPFRGMAMDEHREEFSSPTPQSLESLSQRLDIWLVDARQLPTERIRQSVLSEEENARQTAALAVTFATERELAARDAQAARQHGWSLAGPDTYPMAYRIEPGLAMRPPLAWELVLLEGCLRSIPAFVRKKTRRLAPFSISVPVASVELPLVLSWA